jgi:FkbH-like protein
MNAPQKSVKVLEEEGDGLLRARDFEAAVAVYAEVAAHAELPGGGICVKLARAHLEAGRPEAAARWAIAAAHEREGFRVWSAAAGLLRRCPIETWPGIRKTLHLGLVSTWTPSSFAPLLQLACARAGIATTLFEPDFGQYFNGTLDPASPLNASGPDAVLLCPDHRALGLPAFSDTPEADIAAECARWTAPWTGLRAAGRPILIQQGFAVPGGDPLGHYGSGVRGARRAMTFELNRMMAEMAAGSDVGFVNTGTLAARLGTAQWFDDRSWYMAKMPFAPAALPMLATHSAAALAARVGFSRRCVVLDLDNTLWGGVIGDDGLEGISLGGGMAGEAFVEFQTALKDLTRRGIVLAVCSKNDPEIARSPFRAHPEMVLKEDDIAAFVANWQPKSANIRAIAEMLSLGLDSFVFLDDNPYERTEVRRALPQVDVPLLPEDPSGFRRALETYPFLEPAAFTAADRERAGQYRARAKAIELQSSAGSLEEYQASLAMVAEFGEVDGVNKTRVVQLLNKTNQFNLTTIRRNQAELEAFLERPTTHGIWVRLRDKFADHGLIAVALAEERGEALEIDTLLMSCRVLGRGVEETVLAELARIARERGCRKVLGRYRPTDRNAMVADLYPRLGFAPAGRGSAGEETLWQAEPADLTATDVPIQVAWH